MTLEDFQKLPPNRGMSKQDRAILTDKMTAFYTAEPGQRAKLLAKDSAWLSDLNEAALDEVGRLLCRASLKKSREESPIIGDLPTKQRAAQEAFEDALFGTDTSESKRGELPNE